MQKRRTLKRQNLPTFRNQHQAKITEPLIALLAV